MLDYYALLGVPRFTASQDDIRKAYRTQIAFFHPDKGYVNENIALERTQQLNEAYDTLKNPSRKAVYDDSREGKSSRDTVITFSNNRNFDTFRVRIIVL